MDGLLLNLLTSAPCEVGVIEGAVLGPVIGSLMKEVRQRDPINVGPARINSGQECPDQILFGLTRDHGQVQASGFAILGK